MAGVKSFKTKQKDLLEAYTPLVSRVAQPTQLCLTGVEICGEAISGVGCTVFAGRVQACRLLAD